MIYSPILQLCCFKANFIFFYLLKLSVRNLPTPSSNFKEAKSHALTAGSLLCICSSNIYSSTLVAAAMLSLTAVDSDAAGCCSSSVLQTPALPPLLIKELRLVMVLHGTRTTEPSSHQLLPCLLPNQRHFADEEGAAAVAELPLSPSDQSDAGGRCALQPLPPPPPPLTPPAAAISRAAAAGAGWPAAACVTRSVQNTVDAPSTGLTSPATII